MIVLAVLSFLGVCLALIFRRKLKRKEQELEFEMTDIRNVARIPAPATPYYEVNEVEDEDHQQQAHNKSQSEFKSLH